MVKAPASPYTVRRLRTRDVLRVMHKKPGNMPTSWPAGKGGTALLRNQRS